jgi:hypothetical protein
MHSALRDTKSACQKLAKRHLDGRRTRSGDDSELMRTSDPELDRRRALHSRIFPRPDARRSGIAFGERQPDKLSGNQVASRDSDSARVPGTDDQN